MISLSIECLKFNTQASMYLHALVNSPLAETFQYRLTTSEGVSAVCSRCGDKAVSSSLSSVTLDSDCRSPRRETVDSTFSFAAPPIAASILTAVSLLSRSLALSPLGPLTFIRVPNSSSRLSLFSACESFLRQLYALRVSKRSALILWRQRDIACLFANGEKRKRGDN